MRLHRLIAILLLLESRGTIKAKELAFALETSVRSIYRDLDTLSEAGIPIATRSGPNGGIYLMEGYTLNLNQLYGDDVIHLYLSGMGIYSEGKSDSGLKLLNALLKLEKTLPPSYQADIRKAKNRFYFDDTPWWTEPVTIPCLEALRTAVWRSQKIIIQYCKIHGACSLRKLLPYGLVVKKGDWYLVAYCERAQEIRTFKCERIIETELTEEVFEIPADFSLQAHWIRQEDVFKQACQEEEYYPVRMKVNQLNPNLLKKLEVIQSKVENNCLVLTVNMYSFETACLNVLEILGHVEILEPLILRQFVKTKLTELQRTYS